MKYYIDFFRRAFDFRSRTSRRAYWMFFLCDFFVRITLGLTAIFVPPLVILYTLYTLTLILPTLALMTRRLHDVGLSGWWQAAPLPIAAISAALIQFFNSPIVAILVVAALGGCLLYLFYLTCKKGDAQSNAFGAVPDLL